MKLLRSSFFPWFGLAIYRGHGSWRFLWALKEVEVGR